MIAQSMIPEIEFNEPATVRLISTAYITEPAVKIGRASCRERV